MEPLADLIGLLRPQATLWGRIKGTGRMEPGAGPVGSQSAHQHGPEQGVGQDDWLLPDGRLPKRLDAYHSVQPHVA
jgi:hypothetical protein